LQDGKNFIAILILALEMLNAPNIIKSFWAKGLNEKNNSARA
jgi:hypothetical protein